MEEELRILGGYGDGKLSESEKSDIIQYHSVFVVYKPLAAQYKSAVLQAEDLFYRIKALEKSAKSGAFDSKTEDFKKTWNELYSELSVSYRESETIAKKLLSVEPMYQRLSPEMGNLVERISPPEN
jgi:hypothetical protein